ncbi:MAPEG family protein [Aestuariibius insulae]|uniref:MAPEG family protein n=1 Tax=Aestuariibius insulae TaxID=2058287 RepID=UPI00345E72DF
MTISMTAALLGFGAVTLFALGIEIMYTYATQGIGFGFSSNRPAVTLSPLGRRIGRAYVNQVEAAAYVVPVLAAAAFLGVNSPAAQLAAMAIVAGRAWFVLFYYTGLPFVRLIGFLGGSMGTLVVAILTAQAVLATP